MPSRQKLGLIFDKLVVTKACKVKRAKVRQSIKNNNGMLQKRMFFFVNAYEDLTTNSPILISRFFFFDFCNKMIRASQFVKVIDQNLVLTKLAHDQYFQPNQTKMSA